MVKKVISFLMILLFSRLFPQTISDIDFYIEPTGGYYVIMYNLSSTVPIWNIKFQPYQKENPFNLIEKPKAAFGRGVNEGEAVFGKNYIYWHPIIEGNYSNYNWDFLISIGYASDNYVEIDVNNQKILIDPYETTQQNYEKIMGYNTSKQVNTLNPVENVSWFEVIEYCNKLSISEKLTPAYHYGDYGRNPKYWPINWKTVFDGDKKINCDSSANGYRLLSGEEYYHLHHLYRQYYFEMGENFRIDDLKDNISWNVSNSNNLPHEVGTKKKDFLGLYDFVGNVAEWSFSENLKFANLSNKHRSFVYGVNFKNSIWGLKSWYEYDYSELKPSKIENNIGFRCVRNK